MNWFIEQCTIATARTNCPGMFYTPYSLDLLNYKELGEHNPCCSSLSLLLKMSRENVQKWRENPLHWTNFSTHKIYFSAFIQSVLCTKRCMPTVSSVFPELLILSDVQIIFPFFVLKDSLDKYKRISYCGMVWCVIHCYFLCALPYTNIYFYLIRFHK